MLSCISPPPNRNEISLHFCNSKTLTHSHTVMLSLSFSPIPNSLSSRFPLHQRPSSKDSSLLLVESAAISNNAGNSLPAELRQDSIPNHVAVIMDGNRRWAKSRGLSSGSGYVAGFRSLKLLVQLCLDWGIRVLTVFAFSSDNWFRPKVEVEFLMSLFERGMKDQLADMLRKDIRVSVIGDPSKLPKSLQKLIKHVEEITKDNSRLHLVVAVSYSGKYDLVQACQNIALKVKDGVLEPEDINEVIIEKELETNCAQFPYPDLLIRTSGELRLSNFFLWQLAYTELYFVESLWPDFGEAEFLEALRSFQVRQRRYGGRDP